MALGETDTTTRQRRQLAETAIAQATRGEWESAVETNRQLLELGADIDAYNRLGKALAELGRSDEALGGGASGRSVAIEFGALAALGLAVALLLQGF